MIKKYFEFRENKPGFDSINENLNQARTYLKNKALKDKTQKMGGAKEGEKLGLTKEEARRAESDPDFLKIVQMLGSNTGYIYLFTKMFYEDLSHMDVEDRFSELQTLLDDIRELRQSLGQLPMPIDRYVSKAAIKEEAEKAKEEGRQVRTSIERLSDDLEKLKGGRVTNKWVAQLPSVQKAFVSNLTPEQSERLDGIASAFEDFGKSTSGEKNEKKNKSLQDMFFKKVSRYKTLGELLTGAENYIKGSENDGIIKYMEAIDKVNTKYGELNGAVVTYNEDGILIIEVKSFVANRDLNSNTSHCIANTQNYWDSYVGDNKFAKQYYVYNFNLPPSDNKSVIGVTIGEGNKVSSCYNKSDGNFIGEISSYMSSLNIPMSVMPGMTKEEIIIKKKRMEANKEIIKPKISLQKIKSLIEDDGADVNASKGKPLENAVGEDDKEKTKFLLEMGASPNLNNPIKHAKDLEMIKLLVDYKTELTDDVFGNILDDYDAVEYVLKAGIDPDTGNGLAFRKVCKSGDIKMAKLLLKYGSKLQRRRYLAIKAAAEYNNIELFDYLIEVLIKDNVPIPTKDTWTEHTRTSMYFANDSDRKAMTLHVEETVKMLEKAGL